jgi:flagellar hook-associated protein 3 FlgL
MRITNKIISQNSITNINNNKVLEDKLNTQLATGSKVSRPSDDPVVAIRALRLRTNLNQVSQYYDKNVKDAESWLELTESAIDTVTDVVTDMYSECTKGVNGFQTSEDRDKVLANLKALQEEVYATGDADNAGRYLFSGYRTNTSLTFGEATTKNYSITEQMTSGSIDQITYVDIDKLGQLTQANAESLGTTDQDITTQSVYRMRLAYNDCSSTVAPTITYYDQSGTAQTLTADIISSNDTKKDPYLSADSATDGVVYIPETGELILSEDAYNKLTATKDDASTEDVDEGEIRVTYEKDSFKKSDIRPEHYFYCESDGVTYNEGYLTGATDDNSNQYISYDVGFSQSVRVNTLASELFSTDLSRDVDDLVNSIEDVVSIEETVATLEKMVEADPTNTDLQDRLDAANKASTYLNDKMQKLFESSVSKMQGHLDLANSALTATGNRSSRLELVSNRLAKQKTNFTTLSSDNEDVDITEVAVNLSSVELAYQAALLATSKISQTTLLNYL